VVKGYRRKQRILAAQDAYRTRCLKQQQQSLPLQRTVQPAAPSLSQEFREAPVLQKVECFLSSMLAWIQTAWLPWRYKLPALDSGWQEDQLPAIRSHFFVRFHASLQR
jgi:hypothetical protein